MACFVAATSVESRSATTIETCKPSRSDILERLERVEAELRTFKSHIGHDSTNLAESGVSPSQRQARQLSEGFTGDGLRPAVAYDQEASYFAEEVGIHLEDNIALRIGGLDATSDGADHVDVARLAGSISPRQPTSPFQSSSLGVTGGLRVGGDFEVLGSGPEVSLGLPLRPGGRNASSVAPMVAMSVGIDGYASPGFGLDLQSASSQMATADLSRMGVAPLWSGHGALAFYSKLGSASGQPAATLLRAQPVRPGSGHSVGGVEEVTSVNLSPTSTTMNNAARPSCAPLAADAVVCSWVAPVGGKGVVQVSVFKVSTASSTELATVAVNTTSVPASAFGDGGSRTDATDVVVASRSPSGPAAPTGGNHRIMMVVATRDPQDGALVGLSLQVRPSDGSTRSFSTALVIEQAQSARFLALVGPTTDTFLLAYQGDASKEGRFSLLVLNDQDGFNPQSSSSGPIPGGSRYEHMALGVVRSGQAVLAYRDFEEGQALLLRGMSINGTTVRQVKLHAAVVIHPGSTVPTALSVFVASVPCGPELGGFGSVTEDEACARPNRFVVAYRDGSAAAVLQDGVATADGELQLSMGIPLPVGDSRQSTDVLAVGLAGSPAMADSVLAIHRSSTGVASHARVGLLQSGPVAVGVTRFSRSGDSVHGKNHALASGNVVQAAVTGALRNPYHSLTPHAAYYARQRDGTVVTQAQGVEPGAQIVGLAVSSEYLMVMNDAIISGAVAGNAALVGSDGSTGQLSGAGSSGGGSSGSGGSVPPGTLVMHAADVRDPANVPVGWLPCDGRVLAKAGYPTLWSVIGDAFTDRAVVSDEGKFSVPDLRGKYPYGAAAQGVTALNGVIGVGTIGTSWSNVLQYDKFPDHRHNFATNAGTGPNSGHRVTTVTGTSSSEPPFRMAPPSLVVGYLIKT